MDDSGQLHALAALPWVKNSRYILRDWVGTRHFLVILEKNIPGIEHRTVQPLILSLY